MFLRIRIKGIRIKHKIKDKLLKTQVKYIVFFQYFDFFNGLLQFCFQYAKHIAVY